jgi:hypothetical protein
MTSRSSGKFPKLAIIGFSFRIVIPKGNENDLEEVPKEIREKIE